MAHTERFFADEENRGRKNFDSWGVLFNSFAVFDASWEKHRCLLYFPFDWFNFVSFNSTHSQNKPNLLRS
jgi:hypothetical protein